MGVEWEINWIKYWAGNEKMVRKFLEWQIIDEEKHLWQTPVFFWKENELLWSLWIADTIKREAVELVKNLHKIWIKTAILTGDRKNSALSIAKEVWIDDVIAEVLPINKGEEIKKLQEKGFKVAMVWDGINDAIALSQADVWIAMWSWTDIAIESADITLLWWKVEHLITSIGIAKATMKTIKQNLFFSFFYNSVAIPIAAGVLYPIWWILLNPAIEGAAMAFSSVSVVLNSLRLKGKKVK
jgi:P-type E1-E2 ATPase